MSQKISIEQLKQLLEDALKDALKPIKDDMMVLSKKVDNLSTKVDKMMVKVDILVVKLQNSAATRIDRLQVVPRPDGSLPTVEYPESIQQLLVLGNETLPDGQRNTWNNNKSKALLEQYEDANESEGEDNEYSSKARAWMFKLAQHLGVTNAQLNFAQMTL